MNDARENLLGMPAAQLEPFFTALDEPRFRVDQLLKWIHQRGVDDFDAMSNLAKPLRARLRERARIAAPEVVQDRLAADGTRKWLLRLDDGHVVETVFIPEERRGTLCISSQVGCPLACTFCHTGRQGYRRNLHVAEIVAQMWLATRLLAQQEEGAQRITNVVLMGMGEPLLNYAAVDAALGLLMDDRAYGLSRRRITLSTAGIVPGIDRLSVDSGVSLAISLHAPNDALRDQLVPINRKYPLRELLAACRRYADHDPRRSITFEYVMLEGVNDRPEQARALIGLLEGLPAKVNLIPFNDFPGAGYRCSGAERIADFAERLRGAGLVATTRKSRGREIAAACGQLAGRVLPRPRPTPVATAPEARV